MTHRIEEWVAKAEGDFRTARREHAHLDEPNYDIVCFLSQQCVEKYLKAAIIFQGLPVEKIHNLVVLLDTLLDHYPLWEAWRKSFRLLNSYAVEFRYPGDFAVKDEADEAFEIAKRFRAEARKELGL